MTQSGALAQARVAQRLKVKSLLKAMGRHVFYEGVSDELTVSHQKITALTEENASLRRRLGLS